MLNRYDRSPPMAGEAEVRYLDGDFRVVRPGAFVRCAVSGVPIPLEELKYWSVDLQEAYASPDAGLAAIFPRPHQPLILCNRKVFRRPTRPFAQRRAAASRANISERNAASSSNLSVTGSARTRSASCAVSASPLHPRQVLFGRHQHEALAFGESAARPSPRPAYSGGDRQSCASQQERYRRR